MSSDAPHVVVAGAGVTGLVTAWLLAREGTRVALCDGAPFGDNASGVAGGMLAPAFEAALDPAARRHLPLLRAARDLWPALAAETGIVLHRDGAAAVGAPAWRETASAALEAAGANYGAEPAAIVTPEDWRLTPRHAMAALRRAAEGRGAVFHARNVVAFADSRATLSDGETLAADRLVVATGPAQALAPELAVLTPIKGHILRYATDPSVTRTLRGERGYLVPQDDALAAGATMEFGRRDTEIDPERVAALAAAAGALAPPLASKPYEALAGVRAATPDELPLVGPSAAPGVILAAGLRRNGWLLAPLVAGMAAAYALDRSPGPWAEIFDPRRFDTIDQ